MATHGLIIEWGMPIEGREFKALETFASTVQWWTELQQNGKIEGFRTYGTLSGNFSDRAGFLVVDGTQEQIEQLQHSEEYRDRLNQILTIGRDIRVTTLETGDNMQTRMERYGKNLKAVVG